MIKRLAHVCFFTDNAPALLSFYEKALGFPLVFDMKHDDGTPFGWYLDCGNDTFIEVFDQRGAVKQWGGEVVALREEAGSRYKHICFEVDDLEKLRASLIGKGLEVTEIIKGMDNSYQCWIKDVDGNAIELMQYTSESMQFSKR
ncbi:glyoxalase family protein [Verrucomicrobiia bacterium DG1235]|nr:glyoxalase family protein [Verrucomicrobiae bacterium DG1235]